MRGYIEGRHAVIVDVVVDVDGDGDVNVALVEPPRATKQ
jgi:hypothetical protein